MKKLGQIQFELSIPQRILTMLGPKGQLNSTLHTPVYPQIKLPDATDGTVYIEVNIDPKEGQHHLIRAWASGAYIEKSFLDECAHIVANEWSSSPLEGGSLLPSETMTLTVKFPVVDEVVTKGNPKGESS